ncbi:hypothetical protein BJ878DRAFT_574755 [Calycina marina]|uniref:Uncharacterized protein n=1 Tax=Calycina marina TaxID=1763456 RepID=A0A9P7Z5M2_9HELO|nr:hypothetical protein BJ878DRAFT_574755 [Calycina marina]
MPSALSAVPPGEDVVPVSKGSNAGKPLAAFTKIAPVVGLYEPASGTAEPDSHPTTILFCSWMDAQPNHIDYYTRKYMKLFSHSRIILVTINTVRFLLQSEARRRADVKAAVTAILDRDEKSERLFVHSLSWIIDSAPGIPKFRRDIYSLLVPARTWCWLRWLPFAAMVLSAVSVVYVVVNWLPKLVWGELVWKPTAGMNDKKLIPLSCVKGYVYSKEDLAIDWNDVEKKCRLCNGEWPQGREEADS